RIGPADIHRAEQSRATASARGHSMTASFRGAGTAVLDNSASAVPDTVVSSRWVRPLLRFIVLMLGGLHASVGAMRYSMNPDGVAYLDIGDAYLRQDWRHEINMYWSPLYCGFRGVAMYVGHPSMRWEFPAVHAINFCIYVVALICFEFFWLRLMR